MPVDRRTRDSSATERLAEWIVTQTAPGRRAAVFARDLRDRRVPLHWTNLFGVVSFASIAVILVTGVLLMFFYSPSSTPVVYDGPWGPLSGVTVSTAFRTTMAISFELPGGMLLRQAHHWAALLLPASLVAQLLVTFFTGGFRRPRTAAWVLLFTLFIVALVGGWSGYALPDDMLSGSGLRIVQGIVLAIPLVGTWLSALLFGGAFPGTIIEHLYPLHVAIVPVLLVLVLVARIRLGLATGPAQFRGPGRTEGNVVGIPFASAAMRASGLFALVCGLVILAASMVTVAPIHLFGPSSPGDASAGSQPDWYTGFLDGALRLVPPGWEVDWLGRTWSFALLVPLAVVGAFLGLAFLYPFLEGWVLRDRAEHHLLDRPRDVPTRTAIGVAGVIFYGVLWGAASADIVATAFHVTIEGVITSLRLMLFVGPIVGFLLTRSVCVALRRRDREVRLHGYETGRIVRLPGGEYVEVHGAIDAYSTWALSAPPVASPAPARPDADGRLTWRERARGRLASAFLEDRLEPADPRPSATPLDAASGSLADLDERDPKGGERHIGDRRSV